MSKKVKSFLAGSWYPSDKEEIISEIIKYETQTKRIEDSSLKYMGGVVPHAGWVYSGKIACSVFYNIGLKDKKKDLIVLFGGHLAPYSNSTVSIAHEYETPLGNIKVCKEASEYLLDSVEFLYKEEIDYAPDNTIEVQLPFIKYYFNDIEIVVVKPAPNKKVYDIGNAVSELNKKYNLAIIGSTDLTHYGSRFGFTPAGSGNKALDWVKSVNDKEIVDLTVNVSFDKILESAKRHSNACCAGSLASLLIALNKLNIKKGKLLEYNTSYDIMPDAFEPDSFVGYQGVLF